MKLFTLACLLLMTITSRSQVTWERPFGGPTYPNLNDIIHTSDDFFYVCGNDTLNSTSRALLSKLDKSGNVLWEKTFTILDSNYWFDHLLLFNDTTLIIQSSAYALVNGYYAVPKIIKMDTAGAILDSVWPDINGVYNSTQNMSISSGANNTFWTALFIGTTGISNEVHITRWSANLDSMFDLLHGAFYDYEYSFNTHGEFAYDVYIEEVDTISGMIIEPDHMVLHDTAGSIYFDSVYLALQPSRKILHTEDGGYIFFNSQNDSLLIRHFNSAGVLQHTKSYSNTTGELLSIVPSSDSSYLLAIQSYNLNNNVHAITFFKFDKNDDTLWSHQFTLPYVSTFVCLKPTQFGGAMAICGTTFYQDSINYIIRIGPSGERWPYTIQINPAIYCAGDTVTLSLLQTAAGYQWSTGETTSSIQVTSTGSYGLTATDTSGTNYTINPVTIIFDTLAPIALTDMHSCVTNVHLSRQYPDANTYWSDPQYGISYGPDQYYNADTVPDTLDIWVIVQANSGCRVTDSATIYFDDCSFVPEITSNQFIIAQINAHTFMISSQSGKNIKQVSLYDVSGRKIYSKFYDSSSAILDASIFKNGLYVIECITEDEYYSGKIVITE